MYIEDEEDTVWRDGGICGWSSDGDGGGTGGGITPEEERKEETSWWWWWWLGGIRLAADNSLNLYLSNSALTPLSSACNDWTWRCNVEIAPMQPYTGSLILTFAS